MMEGAKALQNPAYRSCLLLQRPERAFAIFTRLEEIQKEWITFAADFKFTNGRLL